MVNYVVIQAGGRGSRMELLTKNKPKALVPVNNLPMIFHWFRKFPDKKFIIIGDYKFDVLKRYLSVFATVDYQLVSADGHKGTCAGMRQAFELIPSGTPFLVSWCDLIMPKNFTMPSGENNLVGIAKEFSCRWKYEKGAFFEEPSDNQGVAGLFVFTDKDKLKVPEEGEFVRWLQELGYKGDELPLYGAKEYGLYSEWSKLPKMRCRPFNKLTIKNDKVIKEGIDEQGKKLGIRETAWYQKIKGMKFNNIPTIYDYAPLCMEFIDGKNIYEYTYIPDNQKKYILRQIIQCLKDVHNLGSVPTDVDSYYENYIEKTFDRLTKVRNLVPFANDEYVTVNGKKCRNIFYCREKVEKLIKQYIPKEFKLIHGDCTFSNTMLRHDTEPVLIDPRGYFGHTEIYGDPAYDWVKLYYSLYSNYDQFNLKRFALDIMEDGVQLDIASNNWESMEDDFFQLLSGEVSKPQMRLQLALVWLSLTTYAWEDYDSICGAFYYGLYCLEDALRMDNTLELSTLGHTWIFDIDGTIVKHNGYKNDGTDTFLPKAKEFLQSLPNKDMIIFLTAREECYRDITEKFLQDNGIRYNAIIFNAPHGERILVNDSKTSGLQMAYSIPTIRNEWAEISVEENNNI